MDPAIPAARRALLEALREPEVSRSGLDEAVRAAGATRPGPRSGEIDALVAELARLQELGASERRLVVARALRVVSALAATAEPAAPGPTDRPRPRRRADRKSPPVAQGPVDALPGIGPAAAAALGSRGIRTVEELAALVPRTWDDRRSVCPIGSLAAGARAVVRGTVVQSRWVGRGRFEALIEDGTGRLELVFFRAYPGHAERFAPGKALVASGDVTEYRGLQMIHPDVEREEADCTAVLRNGRIVPVYTEIAGVGSRVLERAVSRAVSVVLPGLVDGLPPALAARRGLMGQREALAMLHEPPGDLSIDGLAALRAGKSPAHRRLAYDEFFFLSLGIHRRRQAARRLTAPPLTGGAAEIARLRSLLPFAMTAAQERVLSEITGDLERGEPMQRLLQGDVGSGKTVVALATIVKVAASGGQAALMVPTEILAEQHLRALRPLLERLGYRAVLLTGSQRTGRRREGRRALELGSAQLGVGTHALLSEGVEFQRLGLAIVDEQHRFGVAQRLRLLQKGGSPHLLVMTATPIPRTLALTVYGDLDLSVIDQMPPGREPVDTRVVGGRRIEEVLEFVGRALARGERGYYICPLVSESEALDLAAATERHVLLDQRFGSHGVALLHGQMRPEEKEAAMAAFVEGRERLLVSTTVVEVGIDVPQASFMVIEGAERFGLSQLHQLRGRVGRGSLAAKCLLVTGSGGEPLDRLRRFVQAKDGFAVAELDLSIRGPGELYGLRQSGLAGFRFGDLLRDVDLLQVAREDAAEILREHPDLAGPALEATREVLASRWPVTGEPVGEEAG
ncbi:MAG: ATP-dependent DNA helicase RecG [Deltaproteobacteria bacterium]|nr:ATP-dependent DNA helicase RecG [Deltaproteobacteria bacterium]